VGGSHTRDRKEGYGQRKTPNELLEKKKERWVSGDEGGQMRREIQQNNKKLALASGPKRRAELEQGRNHSSSDGQGGEHKANMENWRINGSEGNGVLPTIYCTFPAGLGTIDRGEKGGNHPLSHPSTLAIEKREA